MKDFNWGDLYDKADAYMKSIYATDYLVERNRKTMIGNEPIVMVVFPKRVNTATIWSMDHNRACTRVKGMKKDGVLYCEYMLLASQL